jgi:hypothetical protein
MVDLSIDNFLESFNISHVEHDTYYIITDARVINIMKRYNLYKPNATHYPKIPYEYIYNIKSVREHFLKGLVECCNEEIPIIDKQLKDDIVFIAHSLGHLSRTRFKDNTWFVTISFSHKDSVVYDLKNDFKVAETPYQEALCVGVVGSPTPAIFLSDFTVI